MRRRQIVSALGVILVSLLAGCSGIAAADAGRGTEVHLVQVEALRGGSNARVEVRRVGRVSSNEVEWTVSAVDPSSTTLPMSWVGGPGLDCGEMNHLEVAEGIDSIVVGLTDTARDSSKNCIAVGASRRFTLHLHAPIGRRALLEPVSGANDGLPHFSPTTLPTPACSTNATPRDAPVGMADAGRKLAPTSATAMTICRIAWPHGRSRATEVRVSDPIQIRRLAATLNNANNQHPPTDTAACAKRSPGAWYSAYFTGPHLQVEVFIDEINCGTVTNGARAATTTPAIHNALAAAF